MDDEFEQLEFSYPVRFFVNPHLHWTYRELVPQVKRVGQVMVDTDWDGTPDALLPGTSNFSTRDGRKATAIEVSEDCTHAVY